MVRAHTRSHIRNATVGDFAGSGRVDNADMYVKLVPRAKRSLPQTEIAALVRREILRIGGVSTYVFSNGFGDTRKQVEIQLRGNDAVTLARFADQVLPIMRTVPGATDVGLSTTGQRPELQVDLNRPLAGTLGVSVGEVAQSLRPAFAGLHAGDWVDPTGKTRDVTVRLSPESRANLTDLSQLPLVISPAGVPAGITIRAPVP